MPTIEELYAKRTELLEELSAVCIEEAEVAAQKAQVLHNLHEIEAELSRLEDSVVEVD